MQSAPLPPNEVERLEALKRYKVLDSGIEAAYQQLVELASQICETPIAIISLVDSNRQWYKAEVGMGAKETSRDLAFCAHAILDSEIFEILDATKDLRFADNPLVLNDPSIRFYAGAPLITSDGFALGTLCAIDRIPKKLSEFQRRSLKILSGQVIQLLELRRTVQKLDEATINLKKADASKERLFSIISHDLKIPFQGLIGLSELLISDHQTMSTEEIQDLAVDLNNSANAGFRLVEQILQWAVLEKQGQSNQWIDIDISNLTQEVISTLDGAATSKGIHLTLENQPHLHVHADAAMLRSVLQNLVSNALKFTSKGGEIKIRLKKFEQKIVGEIIDTGIGMSEKRLKQLLTFENSPSTLGTAGETGTGLGLLLCKQMLEHFQGTLTAVSELGKGSTFTFTVPTNASR